jgi:hypothetical protein
MTASGQPQDLHEYVAFEDPTEQRTWVFDTTFLASNYACIYGRGCQGVYTEDATELEEGCCSFGAHLIDKKDLANLVKHAERLTDEQWQFRSVALERAGALSKQITKKNEEDVRVTRLVDGACIMLNRPGFPGGAGCSLHVGAVAAGERPMDWKPEVCWQVPLRRSDEVEDDGYITTTIREWKRRDWGEGGSEFHWWCTDSHEAFVDKLPVWQTMKDEISEMCGDEVYALLVEYFKKKAKVAKVSVSAPTSRSNVTFLPHPKSKLAK